MRGVAVPVLESALDRSLQLATSMDARGYGRRIAVGKASRRLASGATVGGLLLVAVGLYGVIDGGSLFGLGLPVLAVAAVLCGIGLALGGRRTARSRYRPDPWRRPEWIVAGSGTRRAGGHVSCPCPRRAGAHRLVLSLWRFPSIPLLPVVGILIALAPAIAAPNPIACRRRRRTADPEPPGLERDGLAHAADPVQSDLSGVPT